MREFLKCVQIFCAGLYLASCASGSAINDSLDLPFPDSTMSSTSGDLRIAALDLVEIEVFGVESLNGRYQVDYGGLMKLPLVGEIKVVGMTPIELSYDLERRYGEQYLQEPDVSVTIVESVGRRITLDGAFRTPGIYPITGSISLVQAVALAGGPSQNSNPRKVIVFRQIDGKRHAAAFDLTAIRDGESEDPEIFGNDIIVMDGSNIGETYDRAMRSIPLIALFFAL